MSNRLELYLKSSIFDRQRKLIIDPLYMEFENKDPITAVPTRFLKEEIDAMRYGVKWIRGYQFYIGRIYYIEIRNREHKVIRMRLKSLYGIRRIALGNKYVQIINALYEHYFNDISQDYINQFTEGESFTILDVTFNKEGIVLRTGTALISWMDVGDKTYSTYYALFSESDPNRYRAFKYIHDWNTGILYSVAKHILKYRNF